MEWIWRKRGRDGTGIVERRQRKTFLADRVCWKKIASQRENTRIHWHFRLKWNFPVSAPDPQVRIANLERELHWAQLKIQVLEERLRKQRILMLGPQSETLGNLQLELLAEEEPGVTADEVEAEARREPVAKMPARERKPHPGRERLPKNLPRVEKVISCREQNCSACGKETAVIGYDESEQLDVEPARYFVRVTRREKRACRSCEQGTVTMAPLEPRIIEKGLASDAVVIDTVVSKYCDHRVPRTWRQQCRRGAMREMREVPSKPEIRIRLQTTASCCR
jgi:transposase